MSIDRSQRFRRISPSLMGSVTLALLGSASIGQAQRSISTHTRPGVPIVDEARYDPRATLLLKRMGETYSRLGAIDVNIAISSALVPLTEVSNSATLSTTSNVDPTPFQVDESKMRPMGRLHLAFRGSNKLLMETEQTDPATSKKFDLRWVSDGRYFWSYAGDKKIYTREKAPGNIHDFARLEYLGGGTLELIMLIGPNPFADLVKSVDATHLLGTADVRGVPTDVVSLQVEAPLENSELRLYIGKSDGLLHRMEIETIPVKRPDGPVKIGSKLDALLEDSKPVPLKQPGDDDPENPDMPTQQAQEAPKQKKPIGSFLRFDNVITLTPNFAAGTFAFIPPKDGLMLGDAGPQKHLTMKQRIAMLAKNAKQKQTEMLSNGN